MAECLDTQLAVSTLLYSILLSPPSHCLLHHHIHRFSYLLLRLYLNYFLSYPTLRSNTQSISIMSSSKGDRKSSKPKPEPEYYYQRLWFCCSCGEQGGMDWHATTHCVNHGCYHKRCHYCHFEDIKRNVREPDYRGKLLPRCIYYIGIY